MTTEVQAQIQVEALIQSLNHPIDQLAILSRQIKELEAQAKLMKDAIANTYGEGKYRGEKYGATVSLCHTTTVDYKSLLADLGVTDETIEKYKKHGASIRVTTTA